MTWLLFRSWTRGIWSHAAGDRVSNGIQSPSRYRHCHFLLNVCPVRYNVRYLHNLSAVFSWFRHCFTSSPNCGPPLVFPPNIVAKVGWTTGSDTPGSLLDGSLGEFQEFQDRHLRVIIDWRLHKCRTWQDTRGHCGRGDLARVRLRHHLLPNSQETLLFQAADPRFWFDSCQDRSRKETLSVKVTWCIHVLIKYAPKLQVYPKYANSALAKTS